MRYEKNISTRGNYNQRLERAIKATRKELLETFEIAFGLSPRWPLVRDRILEKFGRHGLERFIRDSSNGENNETEMGRD